MLRGDVVKDDSGAYAVSTEQGSSASQMTEDCQIVQDTHGWRRIQHTRW